MADEAPGSVWSMFGSQLKRLFPCRPVAASQQKECKFLHPSFDHFVSGIHALMWLFWIAAALLPLASCSVPRQVVAPGFDTVVSLQGSIPIDTDGNKVPEWSRAACPARRPGPPARPRRAHRLPPCTPRCCPLPLQVHAHGGQLLQQGSTFFWVGTSQKKAPWWTSEEINVYSSGDLAHWRLR